jgi:aryl-phospho-beta-D-glucosidase BglC (GH1 family)
LPLASPITYINFRTRISIIPSIHRSELDTMLAIRLAISAIAATTVSALPATKHNANYVDWKSFNATGVNLGGWFVQELTIDTGFWADFAGNKSDEWSVCAADKNTCGIALERRYATWITTCDIDRLAAAGITLLRIPTNYATWIEVPGSQLYHGNQLEYLKKITTYAVEEHGLQIVLDLHSLPGGLNGLDIGERVGGRDWFHNQTALDYSLATVDRVLDFIRHSGHPQHFTLEPANEPSDNTDFSTFGTPATLSAKGSEWVLKYYKAVLDRVRNSNNPNLPVMLHDAFQGPSFWSSHFEGSDKIVFDVHRYYFARPSTPDNVTDIMTADGQELAASDGARKFPTFVGEWAIQTSANNTYASRRGIFKHGLATWARYTRGSAYWNVKYSGNGEVEGEGTQAEYWDFQQFMDSGYLDD